jgi:N-acetyl-anhydromuramyl-L-alanine amidase AmpD
MATGTYAGAISWFSDCTRTSPSSANYCIRNSDGETSQVVREGNRAYSQGVTGFPQWNGAGISTEHEVLATNLAMLMGTVAYMGIVMLKLPIALI